MCHALGDLRARQVVEHPPGQAGAAVSSVDSYLPDHQGLRLIWAPVAADEAARFSSYLGNHRGSGEIAAPQQVCVGRIDVESGAVDGHLP